MTLPTEEVWVGAAEGSGIATRKPSPPAPRAGLVPEEEPIPLGPVTFMFTRRHLWKKPVKLTSAPASLQHG
jgi:hypothetical protein